jgi:hypothetical protein
MKRREMTFRKTANHCPTGSNRREALDGRFPVNRSTHHIDFFHLSPIMRMGIPEASKSSDVHLIVKMVFNSEDLVRRVAEIPVRESELTDFLLADQLSKKLSVSMQGFGLRPIRESAEQPAKTWLAGGAHVS